MLTGDTSVPVHQLFWCTTEFLPAKIVETLIGGITEFLVQVIDTYLRIDNHPNNLFPAVFQYPLISGGPKLFFEAPIKDGLTDIG